MFQCSKVPRFQGSKVSRFQGLNVPRFEYSKVPRFKGYLYKGISSTLELWNSGTLEL